MTEREALEYSTELLNLYTKKYDQAYMDKAGQAEYYGKLVDYYWTVCAALRLDIGEKVGEKDKYGVWRCPECGGIIGGEKIGEEGFRSRFCSHCGMRLIWEDEVE